MLPLLLPTTCSVQPFKIMKSLILMLYIGLAALVIANVCESPDGNGNSYGDGLGYTSMYSSGTTVATKVTKKCGVPGVGSINQFFTKSFVVKPTIVGGTDALSNQICWQATLFIRKTNPATGDESTFLCGGTIIGSQTILTASHCVFDIVTNSVVDPDVVTVNIGAMDSRGVLGNPAASSCAEAKSVQRVSSNPDYDPTTFNHDIAVLTLTTPINLDNKPCACALCLENNVPVRGETCIVSGVGHESESDENQRVPTPLKWVPQSVLNPLIDNCTCSFIPGCDDNLFLCAGDVIGQESCNGDSGGPFFCFDTDRQHYYTAGVVAFGNGCARGLLGGQYTKVANYLDWIVDNSLAGDIEVLN